MGRGGGVRRNIDSIPGEKEREVGREEQNIGASALLPSPSLLSPKYVFCLQERVSNSWGLAGAH